MKMAPCSLRSPFRPKRTGPTTVSKALARMCAASCASSRLRVAATAASSTWQRAYAKVGT
jgi:hypothetical protein